MGDIKTLNRMIRHLMAILDSSQRKSMFGMFFVVLIGSLFELLGVSAMLPFIQALLTPDEMLSKPYIGFFAGILGITSPQSILIMIGIGIVLIYLIKNIYLAFSTYLQVSYSNNTKRQLAVLVLRSYLSRPYSFFVENGSGVILRGVDKDIDGVYRVISNLFKIAAEGFVVVAVSIYLFMIDPFLATGVFAVGMLCLAVIVLGVKKKLTALSYRFRDAAAGLARYISQVNAGIKDIMVFDRRNLFLEGYDRSYEQSNEAATKSEFVGLLPERIIEGFCVSGIIIIVLIRLHMGAEAREFVPKLAVFAMGAFRLLPSISRLAGYFSILIYARPMLEATYEDITAAREYLGELQESVSADIDNDSLAFDSVLEIRDLGWQYPQGKNKVLDGVTLVVKKGEAIGVVGESGSGKSTLADLLLRLYKPQSGGIYMDGIDISSIPHAWSRIMSYVPQSVFLMDDTIRANVVFGTEDYDEIDVWEALRKASLEAFVRELPEGLDTIVGERGVKFSGGQRQRIAIARALFIKPQIMILDEATSALDNETEEAVMEAIDSLAGSMTLIIIAHRVTTLKNCDRIYKITGGRALECKYDELL